jgi:hypothetical protein
MATSYARERLVHLTTQLEAQTALVASDIRPQAAEIGTTVAPRADALDGYATWLRVSVQRVRQASKKGTGGPVNRVKIIDLLKQIRQPQEAATVGSTGDDVTTIRALEWLLVAQLTLLGHSTTAETLMVDAVRMENEIDYWAQVEREGYQTGLYLLQSTSAAL